MSDFGTFRFLRDDVTISGTQVLKGSVRWAAPELFTPTFHPSRNYFHTKESDVWAFGVVVFVRRIVTLSNIQLKPL